jgi:hypothetical protein
MPKINEALIRRQCLREHGQIMGSILVEHQLAAIRKHANEYEALQAEHAAADAALLAVNASVPNLAPLRAAMQAAHAAWLAACEALETQRIKNEQAGSRARSQLDDVRQRMAAHLASSRPEGWSKSDLSQDDVYREGLVDHSLRQQINADSRR